MHMFAVLLRTADKQCLLQSWREKAACLAPSSTQTRGSPAGVASKLLALGNGRAIGNCLPNLSAQLAYCRLQAVRLQKRDLTWRLTKSTVCLAWLSL